MKSAFRFAIAFAFLPALSSAQQRTDSLQVHRLGEVVVTAERTSSAIGLSTSAITRLSRFDLRTRPLRTLAEAVQQAPGFAFVDFGGDDTDPQAIVRGFYGGGEADYVLVLVDGRPLNQLENGRVNWDLLPLSSIESIEVVRGASSAAWGDAALGGVINVFTRGAQGRFWRGALQSGTFGVARASASGTGRLGSAPVSAYGDYGHTDGFREHADRRTSTFGVTLGSSTERGSSLTAISDWRLFDEPGALTTSELAAGRDGSAPFHRFDRTDEQLHRLTAENRSTLAGGVLHSALTGELRSSDRIRTVRLSPDFADTKDRDLNARRVSGTAELELASLATNDELLLGIDGSYGRIESDYFNFAGGPANAYQGVASRGDLSSSASGNRQSAAAFARYALQATPALRFTVGGRLDWLRDAFDTDDAQQANDPRTHTVLSPRAGVNLRYVESDRQRGHLYANVTRSFKAPTPDQLYDRRLIPIPFEPFQITFSNADLQPQKAVSYEVGLYHETIAAPGALSADVSLAAYQIDLVDEIDFDINTFGYKNLGESRHRGIEAGLNVRAPHTVSGFANYTLQAATARNGDNSGNYLKAIPRHFVVAGLSAGSTLSGTLSVTHARKTFLDDANTLTLPDWTRVDARVAYAWRQLRVSVDGFNLLDREYSTTGFPDAGGAGEYYYPAAGRTVRVGLSFGY